MSVYFSVRQASAHDVWCRRCERASRFGQWVVGGDACPFCAAPGSERLHWMALRRNRPGLPPRPQIGAVYRLGKTARPLG